MLSKVVVVVPGYIQKVSYSKSIKLRLLVSASCRAAALIDESVSYHDQLWISCSYLWCVMSYGRDYICYKFPFSLTLIWFMLCYTDGKSAWKSEYWVSFSLNIRLITSQIARSHTVSSFIGAMWLSFSEHFKYECCYNRYGHFWQFFVELFLVI